MNLSRNIMMDRVIPKNMFSSPKVRLYLIMTTVALFASGVVILTSSSDIQVAEVKDVLQSHVKGRGKIPFSGAVV